MKFISHNCPTCDTKAYIISVISNQSSLKHFVTYVHRMKEYEYFRKGLVQLRKERRWTQVYLADLASVQRVTVSQIETGARPASLDAQWRIATAFGLTPEKVMEKGRENAGFEGDCDEENTSLDSIPQKERNSHFGIPVYTKARLIQRENQVLVDPLLAPDRYIFLRKEEIPYQRVSALFGTFQNDDALFPIVPWGSLCIVDTRNRAFVKKGIFAVVTYTDEGICMRIRRVETWKKGVVLLSDQPEDSPLPVEAPWESLCLGRVIWRGGRI